MKKYILCFASLLFASNVYAEDIQYGQYSEDYNNCLSQCTDESMVANCQVEEYYRTKKGIADILQKIQRTPEFAKYNDTELSLIKNAEAMQKYNDLYCLYMKKASEGRYDKECKLVMINSLYVDLYKIYDAVEQKKQQNQQ